MAPKRSAPVKAQISKRSQSGVQLDTQEKNLELHQLLDSATTNKDRTRLQRQQTLQKQHKNNFTKSHRNIDALRRKYSAGLQSDHKFKAARLAALLQRHFDLETQMAVSTKTLYKAYDALNKGLGLILAERANKNTIEAEG